MQHPKNITSLFFFFLFFQIQAQDIEWEKSRGGNHWDYISHIEKLPDDKYILACYTSSFDTDVSQSLGGFDYWIVKTDTLGNLEWEVSLGGSGNDVCKVIHQTSDQGFIVLGNSESDDGMITDHKGAVDFWVAKLNENGALQWQTSLGGSESDEARSIQQTNDGGYIVGGFTSSSDGDVSSNNGLSDYWVIKLNANGSVQWEKNYGGSYNDELQSILPTEDNGYLLVGHSRSVNGDVSNNYGDFDYWLVKIDEAGSIEWEKNFGGSMSDKVSEAVATSNGNFVIVGASDSDDGDLSQNYGETDYWLIKINGDGDLLWEKNYGGTGIDKPYNIQKTFDQGFVIGGQSHSIDGDITLNKGLSDSWIVKTDQSGNLEWQKSLGGTNHEWAQDIHQIEHGRFIIANTSTSSNGDVSQNYGVSDIWLVQLEAPFIITSNTTIAEPTFLISPNPSTGNFSLSTENHSEFYDVNICDILGNIIFSKKGSFQKLDLTDFPKGTYFINLTHEGSTISKKLIVH